MITEVLVPQLAVLGLTTGVTTKKVYEALINMDRHEGLSFQNVVAFNLDEYYPLPARKP